MSVPKFGTAGVRALIGEGDDKINTLTISRLTYGLVKLIEKKNIQQPKVAMCYDTRPSSVQLVLSASKVLKYNGVKVTVFNEPLPTPFLSHYIRGNDFDYGINITASHNPVEYNGFKVFGKDGAQLNKDDEETLFNYANTDMCNLYHYAPTINKEQSLLEIEDVMESQYIKDLIKYTDFTDTDTERNLSVAYSPLFGTGSLFVKPLLVKDGFKNVFQVKEEMNPVLPSNSYIKGPNPEDKANYKGVIQLAKDNKCDIAILTDGDGDRLGVAVFHNNDYRILNGNELALLFYNYISEISSKPICLIKSYTTSRLLEVIAENNNGVYINTAVGYKNIAYTLNDIQKYTDVNKFSCEESGGYLFSDYIREKDGIQASLVACRMANYYKAQNKTLVDVLEKDIYGKYGYITTQTIKIKPDDNMINTLMNISNVSRIETRNGEYSVYYSNGAIVHYRKSGTEDIAKLYITTDDNNISVLKELSKLAI